MTVTFCCALLIIEGMMECREAYNPPQLCGVFHSVRRCKKLYMSTVLQVFGVAKPKARYALLYFLLFDLECSWFRSWFSVLSSASLFNGSLLKSLSLILPYDFYPIIMHPPLQWLCPNCCSSWLWSHNGTQYVSQDWCMSSLTRKRKVGEHLFSAVVTQSRRLPAWADRKYKVIWSPGSFNGGPCLICG